MQPLCLLPHVVVIAQRTLSSSWLTQTLLEWHKRKHSQVKNYVHHIQLRNDSKIHFSVAFHGTVPGDEMQAWAMCNWGGKLKILLLPGLRFRGYFMWIWLAKSGIQCGASDKSEYGQKKRKAPRQSGCCGSVRWNEEKCDRGDLFFSCNSTESL